MKQPLRGGDMSGKVIRGKYAVEGVIGRGGMGLVYRGKHIQLGNPVALKFMLPEVGEIPDLADRFIREARIAAILQSENVVRIYDVDTDDDGIPFMAMELLEGEALGERVKRLGRLPIQDAVRYIVDVCSALAEAHAKGIVHRDLKPANMFLATRWDGREVLKVLDFGISKANMGGSELTTGSVSLGSPAYMPPEQISSSANVDSRADIWSLGVCLYRFLSGELPFASDNVWEVSFLVTNREPRPLHELCPDLSPSLVKIVHRCLTKDKEARFQTVQEVALALASIVDVGSSIEGIQAADRLQSGTASQRTIQLQEHVPSVGTLQLPSAGQLTPVPRTLDMQPAATATATGTRMTASSGSIPPIAESAPVSRSVFAVIAVSTLVSVFTLGAVLMLRARQHEDPAAEPAPVDSQALITTPTVPSVVGAATGIAAPSLSPTVPVPPTAPTLSATTTTPAPKPTQAGVAPTARKTVVTPHNVPNNGNGNGNGNGGIPNAR